MWYAVGIVCALLAIFLIFILVMYICTKKEHDKLFGQRFESDKRITFYTKEQFGLDFEALEVPMDNVILKGGIYSYPNANSDSIFVYVHGMYSGVCAYMQDIEFFCKKGYRVLALNHEGTDDSTGDNIRGLANSLRCLDYTINYIKNNEALKNMNIYVAGHSWGGFATLNIVNYHKDIKGIIAFAPFIDLKSCIATTIPKGYKLIAPFYKMVEYRLCGKYANANALKSLDGYKGKVVVLHSKNDNFVNFDLNTNVLMNRYPDFNYIISENKYHNPHYSDSALKVMLDYYNNMQKLTTEEEKASYMKNVDFNKMGELDYNIMNQAFDILMN